MRELALLEELKGMGANVPKEDLEEIESMTKKRYWQQFNLLHQLKAVPAKIICRSPAHWDQSCWINVGTDTNESLGIVVVAKNSPVVVGDAIVGVVEEVGAKQSRIRLLTDASLPISVRALRRAPDGTEMLLAKGEVYGSGQPLWRGQRHLLSGVGFNYDFEDDEGPARDLRTGKVAGAPKEAQNIALIQEGDLLVTTGMDGVFPPNFPVAEVVRVHPLGEGDYSYAIDAVPSAGNFDDLSHVFVLPPL
jgi:cell shape-determining protein MreC